MFSRFALLIIAGFIASGNIGCMGLHYNKVINSASDEWEYTTLYLSAEEVADVDSTLEQMGSEGSKLVSVDGSRYTFKRPRK